MSIKKSVVLERRKLEKVFKIFMFNIVVFSLLIVIVELFFGNWFLNNKYLDTSVCYDEDTFYNYCPNIVQITYLYPPDGRSKIYCYINESSIRVENFNDIDSKTKFEEYDVINIGDSYMQADEIDFTETLSYIFTKKTKIPALQIGYGSWAPVNMYNFISNKNLKPGVVVNVFTMTNDFTRAYYRSNVEYYNPINHNNKLIKGRLKFIIDSKKKKKAGYIDLPWVGYLRHRSYFVRNIDHIYGTYKFKNDPANFRKKYFDNNLSVLSKDCSVFGNIMNGDIVPSEINSYAELSFNSSCWSEQTIAAVDNAIADIENIVKVVKAAGGKVNVFLVPMGFVFPNEFMAGKTKYYNTSPETIITSAGLSEYLSKNLSTKFVSLETVINDLKKSEKVRKQWYFPADGHWNKYAHSQIGNWLSDFHASQELNN